jgi:prolyl-tRNA editing enzyme YbaK/EbsC (Cys-tRNA(Pro) deacylase)
VASIGEQRPAPGATERVRQALAARGMAEPKIREFDASTATAADAAKAIGTTVSRIVKSLIFIAADEPVLVLASGTNRVDVRKLSDKLGAPVRRGTADEVRQATGYAIGGVPPLGHATQLRTLIDRDLQQYDEVWAAAGTPNSVFPIAPDRLVALTNGEVCDIAEPLRA